MLRLTVELGGGFRATGALGEEVPFVSQSDTGFTATSSDNACRLSFRVSLPVEADREPAVALAVS